MTKGKNEDPLNKDERDKIKNIGSILNRLAEIVGPNEVNEIKLAEEEGVEKREREKSKKRNEPPNSFDDFK